MVVRRRFTETVKRCRRALGDVYMKGKAIAIITARGGSKRIPRKNIKDFCGKPIIAYSIEAALESEEFDEVMVSTDDEEIAAIAKRYGAKVPFFRSQETANDFATTTDVVMEVLHCYEEMGKEYEWGCCIYPTAPFITGEKLCRAMEMLREEDTDAVVPVVAFSFPPMRGMYIENDGVRYAFPEFETKRSQDIQPMYHDCGQFYCFKIASMKESKKIITGHTKGLVMPEMEVQDIDTEQDWKIAEIKYQEMETRKEHERY